MRLILRASIVLVSAVCACSCATTDAGGPFVMPSPPPAEACPSTFNACVELCRPNGVRSFGCWSNKPGVEFECECLDGSKPAESPD